MPTENRSSNTEMVSVPPYIGLEPLVGRYYPAQCRRCGWVGSSEELTEDDAQCTRDIGDRLCLGDCDELERHDLLNIIQAMATPQPHPEPIAWMVGTAFWWTKEEAERDAAETGLPIVGLGPMADTAEVERLESRIKTQRESIRSHVQEVDRLRVAEIKYGLKIEERNALLRKCLEWITSARDGVLYPIARDFEGVVGCNAEGLGQETPALIDAIDDALSASAEPSAREIQALQAEKHLGIERLPAEPNPPKSMPRAHDVTMFQRTTGPGAKS